MTEHPVVSKDFLCVMLKLKYAISFIYMYIYICVCSYKNLHHEDAKFCHMPPNLPIRLTRMRNWRAPCWLARTLWKDKLLIAHASRWVLRLTPCSFLRDRAVTHHGRVAERLVHGQASQLEPLPVPVHFSGTFGRSLSPAVPGEEPWVTAVDSAYSAGSASRVLRYLQVSPYSGGVVRLHVWFLRRCGRGKVWVKLEM